MWRWFRRRKRKAVVSSPFPQGWRDILRARVPQVGDLADTARAKFEAAVQILVAEKRWEGCRGVEMTDEIRVTIAGHAARLLLGWDDWYFDGLKSILVYPDPFLVRSDQRQADGTVSESPEVRLGEAWHGGPVILAWTEVLAGCVSPARRNVVLHEFVHVLDFEDHHADGMPRLATMAAQTRWQQVMDTEFRRFQRRTWAGWPSVIDPYGSTNIAEFFAVATEAFIEQGKALLTQHPELYRLLRDYFLQNPAGEEETSGDDFKPAERPERFNSRP